MTTSFDSQDSGVPKTTGEKTGFSSRILVVEDDGVNQELMGEVFKAAGHGVEIVGNGVEALEVMQRDCPSIVFLDLAMPRMDGYETIRRIRADHALAHVPVVGLTASADKTTAERCREAGFDDLLTKPFEFSNLIRILQKHLG